MNGYALAYLGLVLNQLLAGGTFLVMYVSQGGWRASPVARHVLYWVGATCVVDLSWLLLLGVQWPQLVWVLLVAQALVGLVGWQRVWLVWRGRTSRFRTPEEERNIMITAKVVCNSKLLTGTGEHRQAVVKFAADNSPENKDWSMYAPSLSLEMTLRGGVADRFEPGQAYTLTFEPTD